MRISPVHHGTPDEVATAVLADPGISAADELVLFLPPAFTGPDNARLLGDLAAHVAPALGWRPCLRDGTGPSVESRRADQAGAGVFGRRGLCHDREVVSGASPLGGIEDEGHPPPGSVADHPTSSTTRPVPRLILGSALMLFLELALIRWLGANIVHLSYFTNFVLLGSFLGIGVGFLISRQSRSVLPWSPVVLALLVVTVLVFPVSVDRSGADVIFFTALDTTGPPAWLVLPVVFVLSAFILVGPAEVVGRCFGRLPPLTAYRWDLVGSLVGIGLFALLSVLWAPSYVWGSMVAVAFVVLIGGWQRWLAVLAGSAIVVALVVESVAAGVSWSPYYKISTHDVQDREFGTRWSTST